MGIRIFFLATFFFCFACEKEEEEEERTAALSTGSEPSVNLDAPRVTYKVGFILLIPESKTATDEGVLANINKLDAIKTALIDQFLVSTYGAAAVDTSADVFVYSVPEPVYGPADSNDMMLMVRDVVKDEFLEENEDNYDFLSVYLDKSEGTSFGSRHGSGRPVAVGLGRSFYELEGHKYWGSEGTIRGVGLVDDVNNLSDDYDFVESDMHLLLHETFGHAFGVHIPELEGVGRHFATGVESPNFTVMYGRPWVQSEADPFSFSVKDEIDSVTDAPKVVFHPWSLYQMGILERDEVPDQILKITLDLEPESRYHVYDATGTSILLDLDELIALHGDREIIE